LELRECADQKVLKKLCDDWRNQSSSAKMFSQPHNRWLPKRPLTIQTRPLPPQTRVIEPALQITVVRSINVRPVSH
jgi:hypothetical protein